VLGTDEDADPLQLELVAFPSGELLRSTVVRTSDEGFCGLLRRAAVEHARLLDVELTRTTVASIESLIPSSEISCRRFIEGLGLLVTADNEHLGGAQAVLVLEDAVAADHEFPSTSIALARACQLRYEATGEDGWLDRGLAATARAIGLGGDGADVRLELAELHRTGGRLEESVQDLERAVELAPTRADVQKALSVVYREVGRMGDAERALQRAIRLRPGDGTLHMDLGYLYYVEGQRDAAINQFRRGIECTPENYVAYSNIGGIFLQFDMEDEAGEMFERSLAIQPNYEAYSNLGYQAFSKSNFGEAVERFEQALKLGQGDYLTWGNLGLAYHQLDQDDEASRCLDKSVEMAEVELVANPSDPVLMVDLAGYHAVLGERRQALELLDRATRIDVQDPIFMARVGEAYEDAGERKLALDWLGRAFDAGLEPSWIDNSPTLRRVEEIRDLARRYGG